MALHRYNILDTPPEGAFDRITHLAARLFDIPISLISLVDESRGWFKSAYGFELQEVRRDATICSLALLSHEILVIPDTRQDPRLACNPFVQREPGLRFYAGAPLITQDGFNLGTLCLIDIKPRDSLNPEQAELLTDLAAMVMDELELRLAARKIAQLDTALLEVTQGVSAVTGEEFFAALVQHFSRVLGVEYTYIGLVQGDNQDGIETIAVCAKGQIADNFSYLLQDTPCQQVLHHRKLCCYPHQVQALFPQAPLLKPLNVESYVAVPFFDSQGAPLGLLGVMDGKPLENVQLAESLLTIFALRIATELDRQQTLIRQQEHSRQLHGLTQAALAINSALSIDQVLQVITEQAHQIIGAHQAVTSVTQDQNWAQAINTIYLSDKYAPWRDYDEKPDGSGIYACVCHLNQAMRLTQAQLEAHPHWKGFSLARDRHPPMRGWLAAPLVGRDGRNIGLIQLSDKYEGEFTQEDEAILVQLAQMASIAVENTRLYEAEQTARTQAETANRVKDEFLAVLSHELRSPLNPILGWVKLLRNGTLDAQKTSYALETIERNAKLQTQLIEDLLDVSRILQGKVSLNMAPVDLVSTIESALETVSLAAAAKSIQIQTHLDPTVGQVLGDGARLQQVVWNLLTNAIKFNEIGGQVKIQLGRHKNDAQIQVSDTGKGISPQFLPHIFEYFRQADSSTTRQFGGLGLGLAIVRHLVELHGGIIWAESPGEGLGTTLTLQLPLLVNPAQNSSSSDQSGADQSPSSSADLPLQGVKVLWVDDEADSREMVAFILSMAGADVTIAESAQQALVLFPSLQPDIVISDIGMSEMDGYQLIQHIRDLPASLGGQVPAIALTAYAGQINQQQALKAGFQQHLSKPIDPGLLVTAIRQMLTSAPLKSSQ